MYIELTVKDCHWNIITSHRLTHYIINVSGHCNNSRRCDIDGKPDDRDRYSVELRSVTCSSPHLCYLSGCTPVTTQVARKSRTVQNADKSQPLAESLRSTQYFVWEPIGWKWVAGSDSNFGREGATWVQLRTLQHGRKTWQATPVLRSPPSSPVRRKLKHQWTSRQRQAVRPKRKRTT
jgi:hypothetical protein